MSGGSMDYLYAKVQEYAVGMMGDPELDDLMKDIANLLHDAEWWHCADIGEERYRAAVKVFKRKWFQDAREKRLLGYIDTALSDTKKRLCSMIGVSDQLWIAQQLKPGEEWKVPSAEPKKIFYLFAGGGPVELTDGGKGGKPGGQYPGEQGVQKAGTGAEEKPEGSGPGQPGG